MTKNEALQRITDHETVVIDGSRDLLQDALENVTSAPYHIIYELNSDEALESALKMVEQTMPPISYYYE